MTLNYKSILSVAFLILALALYALFTEQPWKAGASNFVGNDYEATSTKNAIGTTLTDRLLKTGNGSFAQVVVTGAAAGQFTLYDATTTNTSLRAASMSTSSLKSWNFPASIVAGTYTFDTEFTYGLFLDTESTAPTSTVMWR